MNKGLINLWYKNEDLIDIMIDENFKFTGYGDALYNFLENVLFFEECKKEITECGRNEHFKVSGIYDDTEFNKSYKITLEGSLIYGSCEECDLISFLYDYGHRERKKAIKLILLNIIQASTVSIEYKNTELDVNNLEESIRQCEIDMKIHEKWSDISTYNIKDDQIFSVLYFLMTYLSLLDENINEKIALINKKLVLKQKLTDEEKRKIKLYSASLHNYPVNDLINSM